MAKKYCIISFENIFILPYARFYADKILNNQHRCDLVFWDRTAENGKNDSYRDCVIKCFNYRIGPRSNKITKLIGYIKTIRFIKRILKTTDYDRLVFLQTHAAVLCLGSLMKKYKGKYIVDIRDYMLEGHAWFFKKEKRTLNKSFANIISSPAYTHFLPIGNYTVAHNYIPFSKEELSDYYANKIVSEKIRISYVGTIRFIEMDKKILSLFANDERFVIGYYGRGSEVLKEFCEENNIRNVDFYGAFAPNQTIGFYKKTDVINNLYGNNSKELNYALSNKLYHCAQLGIPIIVCADTYMASITQQYHLGFVVDVEKKETLDLLYDQYLHFDFEKMKSGSKDFLKRVEEDNEKWEQKVDLFAQGER